MLLLVETCIHLYRKVSCEMVSVTICTGLRQTEIQGLSQDFKISARPDLATDLLKILIAATINSLVCQKRQFTLQLCPTRWFVRKIFVYYTPKVKIEKSS